MYYVYTMKKLEEQKNDRTLGTLRYLTEVEEINNILKTFDITKKEVAETCQMSKQQLGGYLNHRVCPSVVSWYQIYKTVRSMRDTKVKERQLSWKNKQLKI